MKLWLRLHGYEFCSWTVVWSNLVETFTDMGHEVCGVQDPDNPSEYIELWWGDPQFWKWSSSPTKLRVAMCLSEARSILASCKVATLENLKDSDLIICPSESATLAFKESPLDMPIVVAPFGVNPKEFKYVKRDWSGTLRFYHGGVTQYRKGSWLVPEAFTRAFRESDDVSLTITSPKVSPMFMDLQMEYENHPQIAFISDISESAMDYYKTHHVYVSPHLSEGFGLMIPEAMSTGMPCLVSRCSAPREWFSKDYGAWIEMSETYGPIDACLPDTPGFWRVPDVESLIDGMLDAYEHRKEWEEKGKKASNFIHQNMTWEHTCEDIIEKIEEVLDAKNIGSYASVQRREANIVSIG